MYEWVVFKEKKGKIKKFIVKLVHVLFYLKIVFENIINRYVFLKNVHVQDMFVNALLPDILDA